MKVNKSLVPLKTNLLCPIVFLRDHKTALHILASPQQVLIWLFTPKWSPTWAWADQYKPSRKWWYSQFHHPTHQTLCFLCCQLNQYDDLSQTDEGDDRFFQFSSGEGGQYRRWGWNDKLFARLLKSVQIFKFRLRPPILIHLSLLRETVLGNGTVTGSYSWKDDEGMVKFLIVSPFCISICPHIRWDSTSTLRTKLVIEWNRWKWRKRTNQFDFKKSNRNFSISKESF